MTLCCLDENHSMRCTYSSKDILAEFLVVKNPNKEQSNRS